jgi:putative membrane protein
MKTIIRTVLLALPLFFAACNDNQGEVENEQTHDVNKNNVEQAKEDNKNKDQHDNKCTDFVVEAAHSGMMEVEMGTAASEKAVNKEVKVFAQRMIADHSQANAELTQLAASKNITLPTAIEPEKKADADKMLKDTKNFDKAYIDHMVADHKKAVELFEEASEKCEDAEIKNFATQKLQVLKKHLETAESLQKILDIKD